jgi:hypothetical protein
LVKYPRYQVKQKAADARWQSGFWADQKFCCAAEL